MLEQHTYNTLGQLFKYFHEETKFQPRLLRAIRRLYLRGHQVEYHLVGSNQPFALAERQLRRHQGLNGLAPKPVYRPRNIH